MNAAPDWVESFTNQRKLTPVYVTMPLLPELNVAGISPNGESSSRMTSACADYRVRTYRDEATQRIEAPLELNMSPIHLADFRVGSSSIGGLDDWRANENCPSFVRGGVSIPRNPRKRCMCIRQRMRIARFAAGPDLGRVPVSHVYACMPFWLKLF